MYSMELERPWVHLRLALCRGGRTFHVLGEILTTYAVITDYCGQSPFISRKCHNSCVRIENARKKCT